MFVSSSLVPSAGQKPELPSTVLPPACWPERKKWVSVPGAGSIYLAGGNKGKPRFPTSNGLSQRLIDAWPGCCGAKHQSEKGAWMLWLFSVMGTSITLASSDEYTSTAPWFTSEGCWCSKHFLKKNWVSLTLQVADDDMIHVSAVLTVTKQFCSDPSPAGTVDI